MPAFCVVGGAVEHNAIQYFCLPCHLATSKRHENDAFFSPLVELKWNRMEHLYDAVCYSETKQVDKTLTFPFAESLVLEK